ncbi:hypothetical protein SEA_XKCD426_43 [Streptomyces phage Xkcd426]|nr:hypothetical protein SEA_XKCD426_43 [Streptomyces phage Xkcd426]
MARRMDTGWRDGLLAVRHRYWGHDFPVAGMAFPMVEYDRGEPLALISYIRRGEELPTGETVAAAYRAFSSLYRETGEQLPLFTVQYDPRNWAYSVFPHNAPARDFLPTGGDGWSRMTEAQFVLNLYRLRGRHAPDLAAYGVDIATSAWIATEPSPDHQWPERWPHQLMSTRRRCFEPVGQTRMSWRNPCVDIDLAVVDRDNRVSLVVDYKAPGAKINVDSTNMRALAAMHTGRSRIGVAAMVVSYEPTKPEWGIRAYCLNQSARLHLSYVLGSGDDMDALAETIGGTGWVDLSERQWINVLNAARDL